MSLTPTITSAKLLRGVGPPEALSSIAVTFRVYCGPFRLGGGFLRSLMIPEFGSIKCHVNLLCKHTKSSEHHISLSQYCWLSLYFWLQSTGTYHLSLHTLRPGSQVLADSWRTTIISKNLSSLIQSNSICRLYKYGAFFWFLTCRWSRLSRIQTVNNCVLKPLSLPFWLSSSKLPSSLPPVIR